MDQMSSKGEYSKEEEWKGGRPYHGAEGAAECAIN